ncbi:MAG: DegT/DnrJ/EryC1/StrS family aminotransferase [Candidatus Woesearchaeota archaeon]|nr:MAG: DegT/DnrJ/EryC1/StrS family aminotransferase [Candidatus Woesearchaeota archaeon]
MNVRMAEPNLEGNELKYVSECVTTNWISSAGKFVKEFEENFATFCGTTHATSVSNGTTALHLVLVALGIGPGDEVLVPANTFGATAAVVKHAHATPVLVDIDKDTWNMSPEDAEKKITKHTKAIIPVHLYGVPADMDAIMALAKKHNLNVIEDAAESHGATYKGKRVGSIGDAGCFSFYGNKIITTGEGGMVVTNNAALHKAMTEIKNHGMTPEKRYWHDVVGYNYRLTNIQAAVGVAQLERIESFLEKREQIAAWYAEELKGITGLRFQQTPKDAKSVMWMYPLYLEKDFGMTRDELIEKLTAAGIDNRKSFASLHTMPPYKSEGDFSVSQSVADNALVLPLHVGMTKEDVKAVCQVIRGK